MSRAARAMTRAKRRVRKAFENKCAACDPESEAVEGICAHLINAGSVGCPFKSEEITMILLCDRHHTALDDIPSRQRLPWLLENIRWKRKLVIEKLCELSEAYAVKCGGQLFEENILPQYEQIVLGET
ncbi:hypothetical protein LCGC14_0831850 [marine sediment metagenome]|uniref:Uncharacterized protein n=1 Tax=marine sediment metagenome TaxID=412755 RepID=A0A0F9S0I9_9ZZZZ